MNVYKGIGYTICVFLTTALVGELFHAPAALSAEVVASCTHWKGGLVGLRADLNDNREMKIPDSTETRTPIPWSSSP
jgi:hypothetical protein